MENLLALDQASIITGYAIFQDGKLAHYGKIELKDEEIGPRLVDLRNKIIDLITSILLLIINILLLIFLFKLSSYVLIILFLILSIIITANIIFTIILLVNNKKIIKIFINFKKTTYYLIGEFYGNTISKI